MEPRTASADRPALARPQARRRQPVARRRRRHSDHSADARTREHSTDAAIPQRDGRRTEEGIGSELEQQRSTASPCIGKLIDLVVLPDCPRFVPGNIEMWLRGRATSGTCSCGAGRPSSERLHRRRIPKESRPGRAPLTAASIPNDDRLGCSLFLDPRFPLRFGAARALGRSC